ncbi:hypothetical protein FVER53590_13369 [Fusarium verticillioides]|nr:hypothetical protein FVER53590_13369 [Fusarium verticillioides]
MDPLSIIASIAGIATAGASLSKAIYHFISSTRGASREMVDIARNISDLSCILSELRRVLQESAELCSRKLLHRIKSATRRISAIHDDIYALMDNTRGFQTFRWSLKRSEVQYKLTLIESHKTAIQLMLNILILAVATRKEAQSQATQTASTTTSKQKDSESELPVLRQQSENIAYAACHRLADLSENQAFDASYLPKHSKADSGSDNDDAKGQSLIHEQGESDSTGQWLFELAFETYSTTSQGQESDIGKGSEGPESCDQALVFRTPSEVQIAIYEPGAGANLVDILLSDWTSLSSEEITGTYIHKPETEETKPSSPAPAKEDVAVIRFKDAVGRKFTFPYHLVQRWEGMEDMIKEAFMRVDVLYPHILERHYDLTGPEGNTIHPLKWESTVEPGMQVVMTMWPMVSTEKQKPNLERKKLKVPVRRREKIESKNKEPSALYSFLYWGKRDD